MNPLDNLEARVASWLATLALPAEPATSGVTTLRYGDTLVFVTCFQQELATWCRVGAIVRTDIEPSLRLLHRMLALNTEAVIGAFLLFEDRTLAFAATLPGDCLDGDAFLTTLRYVARVADEQAQALGACCGGRRGVAATES